MSKEKESEIIKCKFAGDADDEYCKDCDGISVMIEDAGGETIPATDCGGYEAEKTNSPSDPGSISQEKEVPAKDIIAYVPLAQTTQIKAESGISKEIKGVWYKFNYSEERKVPEGCDIEKEIEALWNHCNAIVDNQVQEVQNL